MLLLYEDIKDLSFLLKIQSSKGKGVWVLIFSYPSFPIFSGFFSFLSKHMAASVNNIAATFATVSVSSSSSSSSTATSSASPTPSSVNAFTFSPPITPQPIAVSWNPQTALHRSQRSSLLSLYGRPGPKPFPHVATTTLHPADTISIGDMLPNATLSYLDRNETLVEVSVSDLTRKRKVVLVAVSGAFVPVSGRFVSGLVQKADEMKQRGVDFVACVSVNDVHVMKAWGERLGAGERVLMLSDGGGDFSRSMGVSVDFGGTKEGFGVRSMRYSLVAVNGVVKTFFLGGGGGDADDILSLL